MAKKNKDITKTGALSYRELQFQNNLNFNSTADDLDFLNRVNRINAERVAAYESLFDITPRYKLSPFMQSGDSWGSSMFDEDVARGEELNRLGDIRADNLPWYSKLSAGVAKGAVLVGTTFLDGTLGLATGAISAIDKNDASLLWDNPFSRLMQQINEASELAMPNYYTKAEQENPWYENIFTANFLGDKLIKNLGFTVGAFYSGNVFSNLLKATKIPLLIGTLTKSVQAPKHIISGTGAVLSAINEGRIEALNNSNDWFLYQKQLLDDAYILKFLALEDAYSGTEMYDSMKALLEKDYENSLAKINEDRTKMGNADLLMNLPILTASNIIQFGKLYGNGFKTARKTNSIYGKLGELKTDATEGITRKAILKGVGSSLSEGTEEIALKAASVISGKAYELDLNNYYSSLSDPQAVDKSINWGKAFGEGLLETLGDAGTWEEGFIGAITGALGMPMFRGIRNQEGNLQSPVTLEGGIRGAFLEQNALARRELEIVDYMNNRAQDPKFLNYWKHFVRHLFYEDEMLKAVDNNDEFDYKNNEMSLAISDIEMFDSAGRLDELKSLIQEGSNLSDKEIQLLIDDTTVNKTIDNSNLQNLINELLSEIEEITKDSRKRKNTTLEDRKYLKEVLNAKKLRLELLLQELNNPKQYSVGAFIDKNGNKKTVEEARQLIQKNAKDSIDLINSYAKFKDDLDIRTNELLTDDLLSTMTYLGLKSLDWKNRNKDMYDTIQPIISNISELQGITNGIQLGQALKKDNELKLKVYDTIINSTLDSLESLTLNKQVDDIIKTSDGVLDFNRKLDEYLNNPLKITEQHQKVDEQRVQELILKDKLDKLNEINNLSTFGAVELHKINNLDEQSELIDKELYENSSNPTVKDSYKASRFMTEVGQAIDNSDNDDLTKQYLKELIEKRYNSIGDYGQLTNPNEGAGEENSGIGDFILIANDVINKNPTKQLTLVNNNNIPTVDTTSTGNDLVGTTPPLPKTVAEVKGLSDLLNNVPIIIGETSLLDSDTIDKLKEDTDVVKQVVDSALNIKNNNEPALTTALKQLNSLRRRYNDLNQGEEFNQKADDFFDLIEERIKSKLYSIDKSNSNDNIVDILLDNTILSQEDLPEKTGEPKEYLRGDLTEFTIDSFNDGTLERYADKFPNYKTVYDKIMYDYINKGNVKVGDTIELKLEPTESNGLKYETVYMYHNGNIVGVLPASNKTLYKGILDVYRLLNEGKQLKTTVTLIMLGKFPYTRTERRPLHLIKGVNGAENVKLGIMTRAGMITNDKLLDDNTENVFDFTNAVGKVYMLLKNSRGKFSPKRVIVKRFNSQEFPLVNLKDNGNPIAIKTFNLIDQSVKAIIKGIETNKMDTSFNAMDTLYTGLFKDLVLQGFHMDLMLNPQDGSTYLQFRVGDRRERINISSIHDGRADFNLWDGAKQYDNPYNFLFNTIINRLNNFNPVFNINAKKINNPLYNKEIIESGLLETYISDSLMVGSWFITNWIDSNGNEQAADKVRGKFNPPTLYLGKFSFNDSNNNQYTFYIDNNGKPIIWKRSLDSKNKEINEEITMNLVPILLQELFKAEYLYGALENGPKQINSILLVERDGKLYALDRKRQRFLTYELTLDFIRQLEEKNNPPKLPLQSLLPVLPQTTVHLINVTVETNKDGKKEANIPIPKELQGIAKKLGSLQIDDVLYPIIIIDRPNGTLHNYKILLPNGKETDFGVLSFTNTDKSYLTVLSTITHPLNIGEAILAFKDSLILLPTQPLLQPLLQDLQLQGQQLQQTSQLSLQQSLQPTQAIDSMLGILDINVHDVPIDNNLPQGLPEIKPESLPLTNTNLNISLDYDDNIELLQVLLISREAWEDMADDAKLSILSCH